MSHVIDFSMSRDVIGHDSICYFQFPTGAPLEATLHIGVRGNFF